MDTASNADSSKQWAEQIRGGYERRGQPSGPELTAAAARVGSCVGEGLLTANARSMYWTEVCNVSREHTVLQATLNPASMSQDTRRLRLGCDLCAEGVLMVTKSL